MSDNVKVHVPDLCDHHLTRFVHATKLKPSDPWRAFVIGAQIALFQGASSTNSVWKKVEGKIEDVAKLGCLACRLPHKFNQIIDAAKGHDLGKVKKLGEDWVANADMPCVCGHSSKIHNITLTDHPDYHDTVNACAACAEEFGEHHLQDQDHKICREWKVA